MLTNTDCTVYKYNETVLSFDRLYIPKVMWQDNKEAEIVKSGLQVSYGTLIYIPFEYSDLIPATPAKDLICKGNCPFEFSKDGEKTVSESMKDFRNNYNFLTVMGIDIKDYGSLMHFKIYAG